MVLMLLMMSNLTIVTMMMILMMIRPGEGGTFCWLTSQPASRPAGRGGPGQNENFYPPLAPKVPCQIVQIDIENTKDTF